jgi:TPR repeat protein
VFRPLAERGDAVAQYSLGLMYYHGRGVPQDFSETVKWYRKAAEQGDPAASYSIGFIYDSGEGVPQDKAEALKWYSRAAEQTEEWWAKHQRGK